MGVLKFPQEMPNAAQLENQAGPLMQPGLRITSSKKECA